MLTALFLAAMVLPAMFLGHMAHEEILSQKAYRKARVRARVRWGCAGRSAPTMGSRIPAALISACARFSNPPA